MHRESDDLQESTASEAPVGGKSVPVGKKGCARVFAVAINHEGALTVRGTTDSQDWLAGETVFGESHAFRCFRS